MTIKGLNFGLKNENYDISRNSAYSCFLNFYYELWVINSHFQAEARNRRGGADKEKKKKILAERRKALNVDHMDGPKLQEKAQELWKW